MNNSRRPHHLKRRFTVKNVIEDEQGVSCGQCGNKFSRVTRRQSSPTRNDASQSVSVGEYVIHLPDSTDFKNTNQSFDAYHSVTKEEKIAKVLNLVDYTRMLSSYMVIGQHDNIKSIEKIYLTKHKCYIIFKKHSGDLHTYMKKRQRLNELEARCLFQQIVQSVQHCHQNNVVVQEIKLKKFVFTDAHNQKIQLDSLEEGVVFGAGQPDWFRERHGCLAYISPEILTSPDGYSGKAADCWSLGVLLYILLTGKYPFFDTNPTILFRKICKGAFFLPNFLSPKVSCLLLNLMRSKPDERMSSDEILHHPWFDDQLDAQPSALKSQAEQEVPSGGTTQHQGGATVSKHSLPRPPVPLEAPASNLLQASRWHNLHYHT